MSRDLVPTFLRYVGDGQPRPDALAGLPDQPEIMKEHGRYLAPPDLADAVNVSIASGMPLLVTGEPGSGKTRLAWAIAHELGLEAPLVFHTHSTSRARDLLYTYDAVLRFHDIQTQHPRAGSALPYLRWEALGAAIRAEARKVVLIDEVDKAPRDFPNDLLTELDRMEMIVPELEDPGPFRAKVRPIVLITSNGERDLPPAFLRRCVFHQIQFPAPAQLVKIIEQRLGRFNLDAALVDVAVRRFGELRGIDALTKRPATSELLAWMQVLHARQETAKTLADAPLARLPAWQVLVKEPADLAILARA